MKWRTGAVLAGVLFLSACVATYSSDPKVAGIQKWTDTCRVYLQVLTGINDALAIQTITPESSVVGAFKPVKTALQPVCAAELPPDGVDAAAFQDMLDKQLLELIKIRKGLS